MYLTAYLIYLFIYIFVYFIIISDTHVYLRKLQLKEITQYALEIDGFALKTFCRRSSRISKFTGAKEKQHNVSFTELFYHILKNKAIIQKNCMGNRKINYIFIYIFIY